MEVTNAHKIEALERLLTAIVGRQEAKVNYRKDFQETIQVSVECDPDDLLHLKSNLSLADIQFDFYVTQKKREPDELSPEPYEGICEVTFYIEEQYWKTAENLKKRVKELEENNSQLQRILQESKGSGQ